MSRPAMILIVEDDEILGRSLLQRLRLEGHDARLAADAATALGIVGRQRPDAVMCDIRLPDRDGENLMREIFARIGAVPTLFMTAYGDIDQAVRLVRAGARDYLTKPFDLDEVVEALRNATRISVLPNGSQTEDSFASFGLSPASARSGARWSGSRMSICRCCCSARPGPARRSPRAFCMRRVAGARRPSSR